MRSTRVLDILLGGCSKYLSWGELALRVFCSSNDLTHILGVEFEVTSSNSKRELALI